MAICEFDENDIEACPPFPKRADVIAALNEICQSILLFDQVSGLEVDVISNTQVDIYQGACRDSTDVIDMRSSSTITVNPAVTGVNGLDTGALVVNTWYYVYLISGPSGVAGLMSTSDPPTLPGSYVYYRRVGWARTESTPRLLLSQMRDNIVMYDEDDSASPLAVLSAANLANAWTPYSLASIIPPGIRRLLAYTHMDPAANNISTVYWRETTNGASQQLTLITAEYATGHSSHLSVDVNQSLDLLSSHATENEQFSLRVHGYFDNRKLLLT